MDILHVASRGGKAECDSPGMTPNDSAAHRAVTTRRRMLGSQILWSTTAAVVRSAWGPRASMRPCWCLWGFVSPVTGARRIPWVSRQNLVQ